MTTTTRIPTEAEYLARERADLMATLRGVENAPLAHRRAARKDWQEALTGRAADGVTLIVAERVGWLLNGSYGKGAHVEAWAIVGNTRSNRVAALAHLIAALEWRCPANFARQAWNALTPMQRTTVKAAIQAEIDAAVEAHGNGGAR